MQATSIKTLLRRTISPALMAATVALLVMGPGSVMAGKFGVHVVDDSGMPVVGASVCFGLPGAYGQFGTVTTDRDGLAHAEVPNVPFIVTVSKTRFSGVRLSEPGGGFNLTRKVRLADGTPGPRCKAGVVMAQNSPSYINVTRIIALRDSQETRIDFDVSGEPSEYRLATDQDLLSAGDWTPLTRTIVVPERLAQRAEVYLQLRKYAGTSQRRNWLEARSEPVRVIMPTRTDG